MQKNAETNAWAVKDKNLRRKNHTVARYTDNIAHIENTYDVTYDKRRPFDILSTPAVNNASAYNIGETYA